MNCNLNFANDKKKINLSSSKLKDHYFYKTKQKYDIKRELLKFEKSST